MTATLQIKSDGESVNLLGTRYAAVELSRHLEDMLFDHSEVLLEFGGRSVTQSFVDELLGPIVLRQGPDLVPRLAFSGCTAETQAILRLVLASRIRDYGNRRQLQQVSAAL